jgi:hypothetical protein
MKQIKQYFETNQNKLNHVFGKIHCEWKILRSYFPPKQRNKNPEYVRVLEKTTPSISSTKGRKGFVTDDEDTGIPSYKSYKTKERVQICCSQRNKRS